MGTIVIGRQSEVEKLATIDLQRYLAQVTGVVPKSIEAEGWRSQPVPAVIIGTPAANPLLAETAAAQARSGRTRLRAGQRHAVGPARGHRRGAEPSGCR